jgi:hypothetical protein
MSDDTVVDEAAPSPEVGAQPLENDAAAPDSPSPPASMVSNDEKVSINEHPAYLTAMQEILALRQQVQQLEESEKGKALLQVQVDTLTRTVDQQAAALDNLKVH